MDPLTIVGAAASVGQLVDLADKAATSAWNLTQSIIRAPEEVAKLAEKLQRFKLLIEQTQHQTLDAPSIDELFPSSYRDVLYKLLESNVKALENLESVQHVPSISSINVRERVRWATVDRKRARDLLADIRDAESSLDTALSMVTMRIVSKNQASLAALRISHEMFQPMLTNELAKIKQCINQQLSNTVEKITIHAEATVGESQNKVKAGLNEVAHLIRTIVASGETHSEMLLKLTDLQRGLSNDVNCLNNSIADQRSEALASRRMEGITLAKAQRYDTTGRDNLADSSASTAQGLPVSALLLSYEMKRSRQSLFWQPRSFDTSFIDDKYWARLDMSVMLTSSQIRRKLRLVLRAGLRLIRQHMIQFDLNIRHDAKHRMPLLRLGLSLTPIYIRPANSPIFQACFDRDLEAVRYLIETGQATIHDVDSESRRGLLEHAFRTTDTELTYWGPSRAETKLQLLMRYLLDVGYNPNVFNGLNSLPAILHAFSENKLDFVTQLIYRGAEIDSFSVNPASLFDFYVSPQYFLGKIVILTSTGFSDWKVESANSLLSAAVTAGDWKFLLFALEIVGLVPRVALGAVLIECGADINGGSNDWIGPLLHSSIHRWNHTLAHFSLYCGANPRLTNCHSLNAWCEAWKSLHCSLKFQFVQTELLLTHLLLHGADPFEPARRIHHDSIYVPWGCNYIDPWYSYAKQVKGPEFARAWSFSPRLLSEWHFWPCKSKIEQDYEAFEVDRAPRMTFNWSNDGWVVRRDPVPHDDGDADGEGEVSHEDHSDYRDMDGGRYDEDSNNIYDNFDIRRYDRDSLFYQNISTAEGRQRMSTFPAVQLLCNALNRAGYRATMDSEGDVWFEDEDGDMYHDAVEFQSDTEGREPKVDCYICRDLRKYGLGGILDDIERGKQKLYAYREEVKAGKRKWCM
ncbi:hypothetical protein EKO27_g5689 [Xylaria grammica]|uniref:Fungal N-terminal domain-containing protein n=1 Tax=Xylaria grammica TaxID=363999 RepID=A0A439D4S4_9PEZI|nr:hypothetical protein EKO27_g5689 [Xylaria grammica]